MDEYRFMTEFDFQIFANDIKKPIMLSTYPQERKIIVYAFAKDLEWIRGKIERGKDMSLMVEYIAVPDQIGNNQESLKQYVLEDRTDG